MKDQQKCVVKKKNYVPLVFSSQVCTIQDSIFEETLLEALTNSQDKTRKGVFTSNQVTSRYGMTISVANCYVSHLVAKIQFEAFILRCCTMYSPFFQFR